MHITRKKFNYPHYRQGLLARIGRTVTATALISAALVSINAESANHANNTDWVGTWGASPKSAEEFLFPPAPTPLVFSDQTIRMVARISKGGTQVRVRLSNTFGTEPLVIGSAHVALHNGGGVIVDGTDRALTFGGSPSVTIPIGAPALSDPVDFDIPDLAELAISIYLPEPTIGRTVHQLGVQTAYVSSVGDYTDAISFVPEATSLMRFFLSGVDVLADKNTKAVVTLGDSITDGYNSTVDANNRWPDQLAERLSDAPRNRKLAVVNEGISGNRVLNNVVGPNGLSRFDRDIVAQTGVTFVTVLLGINDIGFSAFLPAQAVSADQIINGYRQLIDRAHAKCVKIIGATLTPFEGAGYYTEEGEAKRQIVNDFIRNSGEFDAVIDFDLAIRDPEHTKQMLLEYDSGDHLHPSDAGYDAMANSIDLKIFDQPLRDCVAAN
jgi:lysophospholipase L1-like esterase